MTQDREELRRLAKAATQGEWIIHPRFPEYVVPEAHAERPIGGHEDDRIDLAQYAQEIASLTYDRHRPKSETRATAAFIAAANPAAVLSLLSDLEAMQEALKHLQVADGFYVSRNCVASNIQFKADGVVEAVVTYTPPQALSKEPEA